MNLRRRLGRGKPGGFARWVGALAMAALVSAGCGPVPLPSPATPQPIRSLAQPTATAEELPAAPTPLPSPEATATVAPLPAALPRGGDTVTIGGRPTQLIERARAEVASIARSSAEEVQVVVVEAVEWPDSSLGCPRAGMMYAQVITPGYKIVLASAGQTYEFHSATDPQGPLIRCNE